MKAATLTELPADALLEIIARIKAMDLPSVHRACRMLHETLDQAPFWNNAVRNQELLDSYTVDHPEFSQYHFDLSALLKVLSLHKSALKHVFNKTAVEPWQLAALMGKVTEINQLHGDKANQLADEQDFTVVHYLILGGHKEAAMEWIERHYSQLEADSFLIDEFLMCAASSGHIELLQWLSDKFNYELNTLFADRTVLHAAVEADQASMVAWLLEQGCDATLGKNAPYIAAKNGLWDMFLFLTSKNIQLDVQHARAFTRCLIRDKAIDISFDFIKALSQDPKAEKATHGHFFNAAICSNDLTTVETAVRCGWGKITEVDCHGVNILHIAAKHGCTKLFKELTANYAETISANVGDGAGNSVLHFAAENGGINQFEEILAQVDHDLLYQPNHEGLTVAHVAAKHNQLNLLYVLHKKWGDKVLEGKDLKGNNILHHATEAGSVAVAHWLIASRGFSLGSTNLQQQTPLHLLAMKGAVNSHAWQKLEKIFLQNNPDLKLLSETVDANRKTIFDLMRDCGMFFLIDKIKLKAQDINNNLHNSHTVK